MKIFTLTEKVMNGTVTMDVITTIYQAENFGAVVDKLKNNLNKLKENVSIEEDNDQMFSYTIGSQTFPVWGYITNEEETIIKV